VLASSARERREEPRHEARHVVWIAGGEVTLGATHAELLEAVGLCHEDARLLPAAAVCRDELFVHESPSLRVYVAEFGIDRTEVTNERYRACVLDGVCSPPASREDDPRISLGTMPVVGVSFADAERFCAHAGGRLPTEEEWEKAARGDSDRMFPWGDRWGEGLANHGSSPFRPDDADGYQLLAPVGSFPEGASPYGVLDLAGNVWEWTSSPTRASDFASLGISGMSAAGRRVLRGGAFDHPIHALRVTARLPFASEATVAGDVGFRCAYDPA
jgi:formylglycine-generating enzyme required for sulfatase activity